MVKAVRVHGYGGPEALSVDEIEVGAPGPGEVLVRHTAVGLNFIDTYHRSGLYKLERLPHTLGVEGAGIIEAAGAEVTDLAPGDRVAYAGSIGSYCEMRVMDAGRLVKLPDGIGDQQAAAMMLQGMTVRYLIRRVHEIAPGETVLIHAAAGGIGLIFCQWAKHLGATVIGTVSSDQKAALAEAHGCDHPIVYTREDFVARVRQLTDGAGVPVVYDSVGKETWQGSLDCLAPKGLMVSFGNASGPAPAFTVLDLMRRGSLFVTRPVLAHYTASREDLLESANDLFDVVASGAVKIEINQRYALGEAEDAHRDLEGRRTTGSSILIP
ncbi:MAG: quinone oxidoreductase [Alphaproteobacteria bacterium]|nr:quinone oxidoreductase [Alphaproteobacteria bacterium]MCZ6848381.1 quinone oxidoreductase [Alphaproteobacteria bacterium]